MTLSYNDTKILVAEVLVVPRESSRPHLRVNLASMGKTESEFYAGIVEHGPSMKLTSEQWFELLTRFPNRILRSQIDVENILTERQIRNLPPLIG